LNALSGTYRSIGFGRTTDGKIEVGALRKSIGYPIRPW
jgi:hypothetical protein